MIKGDDGIDNSTAIQLKQQLAGEFRDQLTIGAPTNADEAGLRRLAAQIRAKKVVAKLGPVPKMWQFTAMHNQWRRRHLRQQWQREVTHVQLVVSDRGK
jgi:hypothetical protein